MEKQLTMRLREEQIGELKKLAVMQERSVGGVVRMAIDKYLQWAKETKQVEKASR